MSFLSFNHHRPGCPLGLAAIDDAVGESIVAGQPWRTDAKGRVYRQAVVILPNTPHRPRISEYLAVYVLGRTGVKTKSLAVAYANADPQDCRLANLSVGRNAEPLKPGSVVTTLPGYADAIKRAELFKRIPGRPLKLTESEHREFLQEMTSGYLKSVTLAECQAWAQERFGKALCLATIAALIRGGRHALPDFDYAALQATRLTATQRAILRYDTTADK